MPARRLAELQLPGEPADLVQYFAMCGVWSLTTYDACDLRCSYCVSYAQGPSAPRVPAGSVADRLRHELTRVPERSAFCVGGLIDTYPHAEIDHGVTREALEVLVETEHQLTIVTKGTAVLRDLDLIAGNPRVHVNVSLPSLDEGAIARLEPQAPSAAERLEVIEELAAAGVAVQLHAQPWVPGLTDARAMVEHAGGRYPVCFGPLNIQSPTMARTRLARELTQPEINQAYLREKQRVGPRPNVTWQMPVWLGTDGSTANPRPAGATSPAARVRWMLHSLATGSHAMTVLEAVSPFVRCHDRSGLTTHPDHPDSGLHRDLLHELTGALDDASVEIVALGELDDRTAEVDVRVSGTWARPLLGQRPSGRRFEALCSNRYRFDGNGLVVEYWQDAAFADDAPFAPAPPSSACVAGCATATRP